VIECVGKIDPEATKYEACSYQNIIARSSCVESSLTVTANKVDFVVAQGTYSQWLQNLGCLQDPESEK